MCHYVGSLDAVFKTIDLICNESLIDMDNELFTSPICVRSYSWAKGEWRVVPSSEGGGGYGCIAVWVQSIRIVIYVTCCDCLVDGEWYTQNDLFIYSCPFAWVNGTWQRRILLWITWQELNFFGDAWVERGGGWVGECVCLCLSVSVCMRAACGVNATEWVSWGQTSLEIRTCLRGREYLVKKKEKKRGFS